MKQRLFLSAIFGLFGSIALSVNAADTFIATANNLGTTSTPGCTVQSVGGYGGSVAFNVSCSNGAATVTATNVGQYNCAVNSSGGYYVTGSCSSYNLYKKATPPAPVKLTDVSNNTSATNGCSVQAVGGSGGNGYTTVAYKVTCSADIIYVNQTTNSTGGCSLSNPSFPYSVSGSCSYYSVYKQP
jgi:hypothetical protein